VQDGLLVYNKYMTSEDLELFTCPDCSGTEFYQMMYSTPEDLVDILKEAHPSLIPVTEEYIDGAVHFMCVDTESCGFKSTVPMYPDPA
jgi:hypothetical protein